ncbi:MAG: arginine--tRNA ligase [Erysipelotrichaceae bacterium]|nr:arginine--tRNA ligase [Erysipelotrichaceae bacterium]
MAASRIESQLQSVFAKALVDGGLIDNYDASSINIEIPKDTSHGDYSTNIAMQLTRVLRRNPRQIAQTIVDNVDLEAGQIDRIEIAGPGFINLFMKNDALTQVIADVLKKGTDFGASNSGKGQKFNVEFVSANPTGDLHLGHARGAAVGDSICRIMEKAGYDVTREYYINDAGKQITNLALSLYSRYLECFGIDFPIPEDGYLGQDVKDIAIAIKEDIGDRYVNASEEEAVAYFRKIGTEHELQKIKDILAEFRVKFDIWFSETSVYTDHLIDKALAQLKERGYTYEEDGALWFRTTDFNDDKDRVLIKSDGSYTYFTPDIAYHLSKFDRGYDHLVDLFGADHHGYINRMKAAVQALGYNPDQLNIDIIQMVRMLENGEVVKMSKRTGNAVTIKDLVDEIGVDAVRYFFVSKAANTPFDFDLSLAKSKSNENPVYYAQYAHARLCSIKRMAAERGFNMSDQYDQLTHGKEVELMKEINEFTHTVAEAAKTRSPHKIANYIQKLASVYHSFYNECHVLDDNNRELSGQRLALCEATRITLANALDLLGVAAPESM